MIRVLIILSILNLACLNLLAQLTVPWSNSLNVNFGRGTNNPGPPLTRGKSDFLYTTNSCPGKGEYTIVNSINCSYALPGGLNRDAGMAYYGPFQYALPQTDSGGYMMLVNAGVSAAPQVIFEDTVKNLCSNTEYLFWTALSKLLESTSSCNNQSFTFSIETTSGVVIKSWNSGNFLKDTTVFSPPNWITVPTNNYAFYYNYFTSYTQPPPRSSFPFFYGFFFTLPAGVTDVVAKISLDPSSAYKDCSFSFALDNIIVMPVGAQLKIGDSTAPVNWIFGSCFDGSSPLILDGSINYDSVIFGKTIYKQVPYANPLFQWQQSLDGGYTWGDIPGENSINLKHSFANPDTFLVRLRTADASNFNNLNCNVVSNVIKVDVDDIPKEFTFTSNSPVCEDSDIVFNISGGASYFTWGPNGFSDNSAFPHVYHPILADSGWYYTEVKSFGGCAGIDSVFVQVVGPDIKVGLSDSICYGTLVQLTSSGGVKYHWSPADGLSNPDIANPIASPKVTTRYTVKVSDGSGCSAYGNQTVFLRDSALIARLIAPQYACPNDWVEIKDASSGNITTWNWDFGNGKLYHTQNPTLQRFPAGNKETVYRIVLTVTDTSGCMNSTFQVINSEPNCFIRVPGAFTPNGDGLNDYLYPLNMFKATGITFKIFSRVGQLLFVSHDLNTKWNGTVNGLQQPPGVYVWTLDYIDENKKRVFAKGVSTLIR